MTVGIVDLDLLLNKTKYQLNLDVMQISSYYKKREYSVKISNSMKIEDLGWYSIIYVIYNGEKEIFINDLAKDNRVILIGKYFYHNYCVLPQDIRDSYPDKTIYEGLLHSGYFSKERERNLLNILRKSDFLRIHEPSNLNFISTDSVQLVLYDLNLSDRDKNFIDESKRKFLFYYPIEVRSFKKAQEWLALKPFGRGITGHIFIAKNFSEQDLNEFLKLSYGKRRMFIFRFGEKEPEYYNFELKQFIKFCQKAKTSPPIPQISVAPIQDSDYKFLFDTTRRWYNGLQDNLNISIFKYGFNTKEHFKLIQKIKAKDFELYQLLTSTLYTRYQDEQARANYRRVD